MVSQRLASTQALGLVIIVGLSLAVPTAAHAQTYTWQGPSNGTWSTPGNWSSSLVPNAAGVEARHGAGSTTSIDGKPPREVFQFP
jgi:hypothetical protein